MAKRAQAGKGRGAARDRLRFEAAPAMVSARWLLSAGAIAIGLAALCGYATLCLLFYQGQWQMELHPSRVVADSPGSLGLKFDDIQLDYTETGVARLHGWWVPADPASRWGADTVLYLHGGDGSLADCVGDLAAIHSLGINVFAFDYRGFGLSSGRRPGERLMTEDAEAAWRYLTDTRHLDGKSVVIYGVGVGASLAAELAAAHNPAGVVLDGPSEAARVVIGRDARTKILPLSLLLAERFDPVAALQDKTVAKLFLDRGAGRSRTEELYRGAADPKEYFELKLVGYGGALGRFLGEVLR